MCIFQDVNGNWINDVHGLLNYDGEYSRVVDHDDDYDFDYELPKSMASTLKKQHTIQKNALVKFNKLDFSKVNELLSNKKYQERADEVKTMVLSFCKRNKKVLPTILYDDYMNQ